MIRTHGIVWYRGNDFDFRWATFLQFGVAFFCTMIEKTLKSIFFEFAKNDFLQGWNCFSMAPMEMDIYSEIVDFHIMWIFGSAVPWRSYSGIVMGNDIVRIRGESK